MSVARGEISGSNFISVAPIQPERDSENIELHVVRMLHMKLKLKDSEYVNMCTLLISNKILMIMWE